MAYLVPNTNPKIYNVEQSVGLNSINARGDVRLVQYLLRNIYGVAAAGLTIDGWIGPTTISWIKKFQTDMKAKGGNIMVDSKVSRALGSTSSISGTAYTILYMDLALMKTNPAAYASLPAQVPLSPNPKLNPYEPKPQQIPASGGI